MFKNFQMNSWKEKSMKYFFGEYGRWCPAKKFWCFPIWLFDFPYKNWTYWRKSIKKTFSNWHQKHTFCWGLELPPRKRPVAWEKVNYVFFEQVQFANSLRLRLSRFELFRHEAEEFSMQILIPIIINLYFEKINSSFMSQGCSIWK